MAINSPFKRKGSKELAGHDQRLGSDVSRTISDGGVHPRFDTCSLELPPQNGQYIEVICLLDCPERDGETSDTVEKIPIVDTNLLSHSLFKIKILGGLSSVEFDFSDQLTNNGEYRIASVHLMTPSRVERLDQLDL